MKLPLSEIRLAVLDVMSWHFVDVTVKELVSAGKVTAEKVTLRKQTRWGAPDSIVTYPATVYQVAQSQRPQKAKRR